MPRSPENRPSYETIWTQEQIDQRMRSGIAIVDWLTSGGQQRRNHGRDILDQLTHGAIFFVVKNPEEISQPVQVAELHINVPLGSITTQTGQQVQFVSEQTAFGLVTHTEVTPEALRHFEGDDVFNTLYNWATSPPDNHLTVQNQYYLLGKEWGPFITMPFQ